MRKVLAIIGGGIADRPLGELEGRTPLQAAATPALDLLASKGEAGAWRPAPDGAPPREEALLRAFLGIDVPLPWGVLEAGGLGIELREGEVAFRADFVCLRPGTTSVVMFDPAGLGVSDQEGAGLVEYLNAQMPPDPGEEIRLHPLGGNRALLIYRKEGAGLSVRSLEGFTPPEEIRGLPIGDHLPQGEEARRFVHFVSDSQMILAAHPALQERVQGGRFAANSLWLWGGGTKPGLAPLADLLGGRRSSIVSSSGALAGLARLTGAGVVMLRDGGSPAADSVRRAMASNDFVLVWLDEAGEASGRGDLEAKIKAIERLDAEMIGPLLRDPGAGGPCRILAAAGAAASVESLSRLAGPAPYALADWEDGKLRPPSPPGGLSGLWRKLRGEGAPAAPGPRMFSELLCATAKLLEPRALRRRLLEN
ncbi:MAG: hypothetical protein HYZ11_16080 [Candidatus Tectomicrobia bacterium]|uniref:Metalloenzyme domain-containing protein n=1 Tax=Tectimicrobiota bacterium TaxID=2528274 RepID=A0A932I3B2_UNCTE|nr:hypothetical protein [Candidatus Tectomicrobia bacterium]